MPDNLTPPQGLNAVVERTTYYGLPMGIPSGGGGTQVKVSLPPTYTQGSGQKVILIGDYEPAVYPPEVEFLNHTKSQVAGMGVSVIQNDAQIQPIAGMKVRVIPDSEIIKARAGAGTTPASVEVVSI